MEMEMEMEMEMQMEMETRTPREQGHGGVIFEKIVGDWNEREMMRQARNIAVWPKVLLDAVGTMGLKILLG